MKAPTEAQAAAWLRTVIAPLLRGLDRVLEHTERRDWTFVPPDQLRWIVPAASMIPRVYQPNFSQMTRQGARLASAVATYDRAQAALAAAARGAFDALVAHPGFLRLTVPDQRAVLGGYVVNNRREPPRHVALFTEWTQIGGELLALRDDAAFGSLDRSGAALDRAAGDLLSMIVSLRDTLADRYGLPAVEARDD